MLESLWASLYHRGVALCIYISAFVQCNILCEEATFFVRHATQNYVKFWSLENMEALIFCKLPDLCLGYSVVIIIIVLQFSHFIFIPLLLRFNQSIGSIWNCGFESSRTIKAKGQFFILFLKKKNQNLLLIVKEHWCLPDNCTCLPNAPRKLYCAKLISFKPIP